MFVSDTLLEFRTLHLTVNIIPT